MPEVTSVIGQFSNKLSLYKAFISIAWMMKPGYLSGATWVAVFDFMNTAIVAFSALTLLVGIRKSIRPVKNWVVRYWHGYLSEVRWDLFAYGPFDAVATPLSLASLKSRLA